MLVLTRILCSILFGTSKDPRDGRRVGLDGGRDRKSGGRLMRDRAGEGKRTETCGTGIGSDAECPEGIGNLF